MHRIIKCIFLLFKWFWYRQHIYCTHTRCTRVVISIFSRWQQDLYSILRSIYLSSPENNWMVEVYVVAYLAGALCCCRRHKRLLFWRQNKTQAEMCSKGHISLDFWLADDVCDAILTLQRWRPVHLPGRINKEMYPEIQLCELAAPSRSLTGLQPFRMSCESAVP